MARSYMLRHLRLASVRIALTTQIQGASPDQSGLREERSTDMTGYRERQDGILYKLRSPTSPRPRDDRMSAIAASVGSALNSLDVPSRLAA